MFIVGTSHYCAVFYRRKAVSYAIKFHVGIVINILMFNQEIMASNKKVDSALRVMRLLCYEKVFILMLKLQDRWLTH